MKTIQGNAREILKQGITEYMYREKDGLNCLKHYLNQEKIDSSTQFLSGLIHYIWRSYVYDMGQRYYWWKTNPPPPLLAPAWLEEHLNPLVSKWIDEHLALSSSG